MAKTPKDLRKWVKDEKRLIKLLYRKGFLVGQLDIKGLYWSAYKTNGKRYKHGKYRFSVYLPELHYCTCDYWGECDEWPVTRDILDNFFWNKINEDWDADTGDWPTSTTKVKSRKDLLLHLNTLPTVFHDSKINKLLIKKEI
jgi:hypothetical protein